MFLTGVDTKTWTLDHKQKLLFDVTAYDIEINSNTDKQGWEYSFNFCHRFGSTEDNNTWVRRRYYTKKQWEKPTRVMERERYWWDTKAWEVRFFSREDHRYWTVKDEKIKSIPLPNFSIDGYRKEVGNHTDAEGWEYAIQFGREFGPEDTFVLGIRTKWVRRRYWYKERSD